MTPNPNSARALNRQTWAAANQSNPVTKLCSFCGQSVELSLTDRNQKCKCGVVYIYQPRIDRPSRKYLNRLFDALRAVTVTPAPHPTTPGGTS